MFAGVERMTPAEIGSNVVAALTWLQDKPEHRAITTQLEMVAMNLKNLKAAMPMLKVRCARCNAMIPTGVEMSWDTFRNATYVQRTVECPKCESLQTWTVDDVDRSVFRNSGTEP